MPLQNRCLPTGEIVAHPARGTLTGNRGILHVADGVMGRALWRHKAWICCTLSYKNRKRAVMTGRTWTELFFLDEATALAAGHRPCATCRRADYLRFKVAWQVATGRGDGAARIDDVLHSARIVPGSTDQRRHTAPLAALPPGAFVMWQDRPHLVGAQGLQACSPGGYRLALSKTRGAEVTVITPAPMIGVLRAGYTPLLHDTAVV